MLVCCIFFGFFFIRAFVSVAMMEMYFKVIVFVGVLVEYLHGYGDATWQENARPKMYVHQLGESQSIFTFSQGDSLSLARSMTV